MASTINTNISAMSAQRYLATTQNTLAVSMARLSSGLRVNSAKDDAAGLAIAERMTSQVRGMNVGMRNANDGISMSQTAEGALGKVGEIFQRMRELAVQATNATNSSSDKTSLDTEFGELAKEIQRVFSNTTFNGLRVIASDANDLAFQVGANTSADNQITIKTTNMLIDPSMWDVVGPAPGAAAALAVANAASSAASLAAVGAPAGSPLLIAEAAAIANAAATLAASTGIREVITGSSSDVLAVIGKLDVAINKVSNERSVIGAAQSRFESAISYLQISTENQTAARSRIMDADFAQETANLSRAQILSQAGSAMLAQANQLPQSVMALLRG
jgi:flagellin